MRVKLTNDNDAAYRRAFIANARREATDEIMRTLVGAEMFGVVRSYAFVNDVRPSGLVALYDEDSAEGRRIRVRQALRHDASTCEHEDCEVCDVMYMQANDNAAYL